MRDAQLTGLAPHGARGSSKAKPKAANLGFTRLIERRQRRSSRGPSGPISAALSSRDARSSSFSSVSIVNGVSTGKPSPITIRMRATSFSISVADLSTGSLSNWSHTCRP